MARRARDAAPLEASVGGSRRMYGPVTDVHHARTLDFRVNQPHSRVMRRFLLVLAPLLLLSSRAAAQTESTRPARLRLVVHLAIDQLRPEYLDQFASQFTGGLARLTRGGAYFPNGYQDHGITETAPGHSTMMPGIFAYLLRTIESNSPSFT